MSAYDDVIAALWHGKDPFDGSGGAIDKQGWNCLHPYLVELVRETCPKIVVEVGVWKGASVITMAREMHRLALDSVVVAVDTWLGSHEHWLNYRWRTSLPQLYDTFRANIMDEGLQHFVVPLPLDSINAFHVLARQLGTIDAVHIDGAHDYESVSGDFRRWWMLLRSGGFMIADDYYEDGSAWPDVRMAMQQHLRSGIAVAGFASRDGKCRLVKG